MELVLVVDHLGFLELAGGHIKICDDASKKVSGERNGEIYVA